MNAVGTKKNRQASGLLIALVASTLMLGACGEGVFFANEGPSTTAAATDSNAATTATPGAAPTTDTPSNGATPAPGGVTPTPTPTDGTTPSPTPNPTPSPTPNPTPSPSPNPTPSPSPNPTPSPSPNPTPSPTPNPTPSPTPNPTPSPAPAPAPSAGSVGKTLWANNCQACHGGSTGKGSSASNTLTAIRNNTGGMGFLSGSIGPTEASQIATYAGNPGAY
jgi:outer membrane biosynthesis protein TonB